MSLITRIQHEIANDDEDQSERLVETYNAADDVGKKAIDDAFICLCGWSLATMIVSAKLAPRKPYVAPPIEEGFAHYAGSSGDGKINLTTGEMIPPYGEDDEGCAKMVKMVKVDLEELRHAYGDTHPKSGFGYDVLELAGWYEDGAYGEAEESWRNDWVLDVLEAGDESDHRYKVAKHFDVYGRDAARAHTEKMQKKS